MKSSNKAAGETKPEALRRGFWGTEHEAREVARPAHLGRDVIEIFFNTRYSELPSMSSINGLLISVQPRQIVSKRA